MGARFESFSSNSEQINLTTQSNGQLLIPTEHIGRPFNLRDQTPYSADSPVAKIYQALAPSMGAIDASGSSGTGYVVRSDGFMVTDHHVVTRADNGNVKVTINGQSHDAVWVDDAQARRVSRDLGARNDLALLKIIPNYPGEEFKPVKYAAPGTVKQGDPMVMVGFPLGTKQLFASPTADLDGFLRSSVPSRAGSVRLGDWTDASKIGPKEDINRRVIHADIEGEHGNSGSALGSINAKGEVVVVGTVGMATIDPNTLVGTDIVATPIQPTLDFLSTAGINPDVAQNTAYLASNDRAPQIDTSVSPPARVQFSTNYAELQYRFSAETLFEFS